MQHDVIKYCLLQHIEFESNNPTGIVRIMSYNISIFREYPRQRLKYN